MLSKGSTPLRSALLSLKFQPTLLTPCTATSTSIPVHRRLESSSHNAAPSTPSNYHTALLRQSPNAPGLRRPIQFLSVRSISETHSPSPPTDPQQQYTPQPPPNLPSTPLTWNTYLALRKTRRRYNLLFSAITSLGTTVLGASYLAQQSLESIALFSLDPIVVLGLTMTACMGAGWLMGPFLGNALFRMRHRQQWGEIVEKEKDLFRRIKKHRVDPSGASTANPVPDYYGEKIDSVRGYRNWMKDQRAFNKKRQNFL